MAERQYYFKVYLKGKYVRLAVGHTQWEVEDRVYNQLSVYDSSIKRKDITTKK